MYHVNWKPAFHRSVRSQATKQLQIALRCRYHDIMAAVKVVLWGHRNARCTQRRAYRNSFPFWHLRNGNFTKVQVAGIAPGSQPTAHIFIQSEAQIAARPQFGTWLRSRICGACFLLVRHTGKPYVFKWPAKKNKRPLRQVKIHFTFKYLFSFEVILTKVLLIFLWVNGTKSWMVLTWNEREWSQGLWMSANIGQSNADMSSTQSTDSEHLLLVCFARKK